MYDTSSRCFDVLSTELTLEQCDETEHPKGIDITNKVIELPVGERDIWIIARVTEPNPFQTEKLNWSFHTPTPPSGIMFLGSKLKIIRILQSKEQEGNYTVEIGDYQAYFTLLVQGINKH